MKQILLGLTVYGDHHLQMFEKYCLPSLMADGNLPALAKHRVIIFNIHTDKDGFTKLFNKIGYNTNLIVDVINDNKYDQLGRHQTQDLREAKKIGADYHCLMPDYIYSEKFFTGMLKAIELGHKAIGRLVVSTVMEKILPLINPNMSAKKLATLSLLHIHPGIRNWLVTPVGYPQTHVLAFVGKDTLGMYSPHIHPVYIANEAILPINEDFPLDCMLDRITDEPIYCPKPEDEMVIIELTPEGKRKSNYTAVDLKEFKRIFKWDTRDSPKQLAIFKEATIDPIDREMIGNDNYWQDNDIAKIKQTVYDALEGE